MLMDLIFITIYFTGDLPRYRCINLEMLFLYRILQIDYDTCHNILEIKYTGTTAAQAKGVADALRKAYLTNTPIASRQSGRHYAKLLDWMPLAVSQMLSKDSLKIDPKSPEGLPFYIVGPSPFDLTNLGDYVKKAEDAVKVIKKIGEQKARTEVEECIDDLSNLVPV